MHAKSRKLDLGLGRGRQKPVLREHAVAPRSIPMLGKCQAEPGRVSHGRNPSVITSKAVLTCSVVEEFYGSSFILAWLVESLAIGSRLSLHSALDSLKVDFPGNQAILSVILLAKYQMWLKDAIYESQRIPYSPPSFSNS